MRARMSVEVDDVVYPEAVVEFDQDVTPVHLGLVLYGPARYRVTVPALIDFDRVWFKVRFGDEVVVEVEMMPVMHRADGSTTLVSRGRPALTSR